MLHDLEDILSRGAWMVDEQRDHVERARYLAMTPEEQRAEDARLVAEPDRIVDAGKVVEVVLVAYIDEAKKENG